MKIVTEIIRMSNEKHQFQENFMNRIFEKMLEEKSFNKIYILIYFLICFTSISFFGKQSTTKYKRTSIIYGRTRFPVFEKSQIEGRQKY